MSTLTILNARILTLAGGELPRRGAALRELGVIERGFIRVEDGRIVEVGDGESGASEGGGGGSTNHLAPRRGKESKETLTPPLSPPEVGEREGMQGSSQQVIDAGGRVLMPAFVDCHTHACWAGDRLDEWQSKLAGAEYLEILKAGGGIMSTVRAVRQTSEEGLTRLLLQRLDRMAALGTGTVEVKSGYGLTPDDELKMLRAIRAAGGRAEQAILPTFLGAHAIDDANPDFVEQTINETLPAAVLEFPGITCDAFCDRGAWSLQDTRRLFENALDLGCRLRVHADQFTNLGMTRLAADMGAVSVDHLEVTPPKDLEYLARSATIGVMLPCCGFHLDDRYAPARELVDAGGAAAIATNYNPGSAPSPSMPFTIALAVRKLKLTPAEAISAATINAACVLGMQGEVGSIEVGKRADLQLLDCADERELAFEVAWPGPRLVILSGRIVRSSADESSASRMRTPSPRSARAAR